MNIFYSSKLTLEKRDVLLKYLTWVNPVVYQVPTSYIIPVNFGLFGLASIYQALLAFSALQTENNLQLLGICVLNIALFCLAVFRYGQTKMTAMSLPPNHGMYNRPFVDRSVNFWPSVQPCLVASTVIIGLCSVFVFGLAYKLHLQFAWSIYRHIHGSAKIRRQFLTYQVGVPKHPQSLLSANKLGSSGLD